MPRRVHREAHRTGRLGWLRASVLGANDGLLSTGSLIIGVASASASHASIVVAGCAGLVAGAMSMAAGEYVSVSSQRDAEQADLLREGAELSADPAGEHLELENIYVERGLDPELAKRVAAQLMAKDALQAHARDELGLIEATAAKPLQAGLASAAAFALGATPPLVVAVLAPGHILVVITAVMSIAGLVALGAAGARAGGAPIVKSVVRVTFWGALAMIVTAVVGRLFGAVV